MCGGSFDAISPTAGNSERLAQAIPDARLALFDAGRALFLQDGAVWPAIVGFLGERARP